MNTSAVPSDSWITPAMEALEAALRGAAPPVEFLPADDDDARWAPRPDAAGAGCSRAGDSGADEEPAVVVRTSGSTGTPKQTLLSADSLRASAEATATALGGRGQWLLTLQPSYVAGLAVLSRSLHADTTPVALLQHTTDPRAFAEAAERMTADRRFVSLVPTQLSRLLQRGEHRTYQALRSFDAILLGGGATAEPLLHRAEDAGLRVIRTYGMSETCGGCVYDGHPLPGVRIDVDDDSRVRLSGAMVALGYLGDPQLTAERFDLDPRTGRRRHRTEDLGTLDWITAQQVRTAARIPADQDQAGLTPQLRITGRSDDVVTTGGVKVSTEQVRAVLLTDARVQDAFVAGVPDPDWGQRLCAAVVLAPESSQVSPGAVSAGAVSAGAEGTEPELLGSVREQLGPAAVPKQLHFLAVMPLLNSGKPDRQELLRGFAVIPPP